MNKDNLKNMAFECRKTIIKMATNGGCFIGASLSCIDLIVYMYNEFLNVSKSNLKDSNRDILLLSKGHDVPALYATFAELGFIEKSRLKNHLSTNDDIYWHPNTNIPGVEFHSGSLGHCLSVGIGFALSSKMDNLKNKIVVILGDGELNEGSNWESFLIGNALNLDNLTVIVDRNEFQANVKTEDLIPLEPLGKKLVQFGWEVLEFNGHDFSDMDKTFRKMKVNKYNKPRFLISNSVRGKGLPSIERDPTRWFVNFTEKEIVSLLLELESGLKTKLESNVIIAR